MENQLHQKMSAGYYFSIFKKSLMGRGFLAASCRPVLGRVVEISRSASLRIFISLRLHYRVHNQTYDSSLDSDCISSYQTRLAIHPYCIFKNRFVQARDYLRKTIFIGWLKKEGL